MSVFAKEDLDAKTPDVKKNEKEGAEDDVIVVKEIKQEKSWTNKLPPHLTCSLCSGLLKDPVQLPCCKTALCKLCAFGKLEQHNACWFGFCPKSALMSKEEMKVSPQLTIQVDLWRIQRNERFKERSMGAEVKVELNVDASRVVAEVKPKKKVGAISMVAKVKAEKNVEARSMVAEVKAEKIVDGKFDIVPKSEYIEADIKHEKKEGIRYKVTKTVIKSEKGLEKNREKELQSNKDCFEVKNDSARLTLPKSDLLKAGEESRLRMSKWVNICRSEEEEPINIATENDGTLLLSSVRSQFPGTTGLKYKNAETNGFCGVRCHQEVLFPPRDEGWSGLKFVCVRPIESKQHKRKAEKEGQMSIKNRKVDDIQTRDLMIRGLPDQIGRIYVKNYFERFGEVISVYFKKRPVCIACIRFAKKEDEEKVMSQKHKFLGRWYDVQVSDIDKYGNNGSTGKNTQQDKKCATVQKVENQDEVRTAHNKQTDSNSKDDENERKIYVGRITESLTAEDLKDHFETFGHVTNVHIPRRGKVTRYHLPRRLNFAFVHFADRKVASALQDLGDHVIKGVCVTVKKPLNKIQPRKGIK